MVGAAKRMTLQGIAVAAAAAAGVLLNRHCSCLSEQLPGAASNAAAANAARLAPVACHRMVDDWKQAAVAVSGLCSG